MENFQFSKRAFMYVLTLMLLLPSQHAYSGDLSWSEGDLVTIAIIPLEYRGDSRFRRFNVGEQMSALLTDYLVNQNVNFQLVERAQIDKILSEHRLIKSGVVDPSRGVEIGRLLGADALVFGTVTQFNMTSSGRVRVQGLGGVGGTRGRVELVLRMVHAETGVILGSVKGNASATGASFDGNVKSVNFRGVEFMESAIGRATYRAVDEAGENFIPMVDKNSDKLLRQTKLEVRMGRIIQLLENGVILDIGANHGIREKQRLQVARLLQVDGIDQAVRVPIGTIEIISVQTAAAVGISLVGGDEFNVGDVVLIE
jgi:curli biogenesis system outer membrane secretion channel CsgG